MLTVTPKKLDSLITATLREFGDMTPQELAYECGVSEEAARSSVARLVAQLSAVPSRLRPAAYRIPA